MEKLIKITFFSLIFSVTACGGGGEPGSLANNGSNSGQNSETSPDTVEPVVEETGEDAGPLEPTVPFIANVYFSTGEGNDLQPAIDLLANNLINLADFADTLVNIEATTVDVANTGSIHFLLQGPTAIDRIENDAPYTLANASEGLNPSAGEPVPGDYTLTVTPWGGLDGSGDRGKPVRVIFSLINEDDTVVLRVADDSYSLIGEDRLDIAADRGVLSNDEYDATSTLTLSVSELPAKGQVTLSQDGSFSYTPTAGATGLDRFVYSVTDGRSTATGEVSISIEATPTADFTPIVPSEDSQLIYVSSSTGSDANNCFSPATPCQTINAGRDKMRAGYPDHLYLKRGDVWRDQSLNNFPSGRSIAEPAVIAFYGSSGPRPKLEVSGQSNIGKGGINFIHIIGLELSHYALDVDHPEFTGSGSANVVMVGNHQDILFEDNVFNHIEVVAHSHNGSNPRDIVFRRNIWTGDYWNNSSYSRNKRPSNLYMSIDGLQVIENVIDYGGWHPQVTGAGANMFNHNIYTQAGQDGDTILIKGNIVTRGSSHGIQLRSGGLAENNFFARNAIGLSIGYKDPDMYPGTRAHVINNVVSEGYSMVKGDNACSFENSCSRALRGLDVDLRGALVDQDADWQVHGNVVSRLAEEDTDWRRLYDDKYGLMVEGLMRIDDPRVQASDNIVWRWNDNGEAPDSYTYPDPDRTLADYNASLGGARDFDAFMQVVLARPLQTWDASYTAYAINDYIRAGFGR